MAAALFSFFFGYILSGCYTPSSTLLELDTKNHNANDNNAKHDKSSLCSSSPLSAVPAPVKVVYQRIKFVQIVRINAFPEWRPIETLRRGLAG
ncbi:hypothetical protein B0T20DRAFT_99782 [Sordaria brevicollis]|uniref:Secreted protein n=1 Tax=Sordaria brevicollis TaxID=83679 RepID=A0AAE0U2K3_SORBR|nr:hypothetical protein B0T20DRAFT_99782 [Sordaria brevicollis]